MVADPPLGIADDAIDHARDTDQPDGAPALLGDLPTRRLGRGLAELDETAGQAPLARRGSAATPHEQHAPLVQHDRAHPDPRRVRILTLHATPAIQESVAYLSATRP